MLNIYNNGEEFMSDNKAIMLENETELNLFWRNTQSKKTIEEGFIGMKAYNADSYYLVIQNKPYPRVCYCNGVNIAPLAKEIFEHLKDNIADSINGNIEAVNQMIKVAKEYGIEYKQSHHLNLRILDEVNDIDIVDGEFICAKDREQDVSQWILNFIADCNLTDNIEDPQAKSKELCQSGMLFFYVVDGNVVTMAANHRNTATSGGVGWVYTPDELRGNGYSMACMKYLTKNILEKYETAFLYADVVNPISNHIYQKLGYDKVGEFVQYDKV